MATESMDKELGSVCPNFILPSVDGKMFGRDNFEGSEALLVAFICNHCPYVKAIEDRLIALSRCYSVNKLQVVGICSNDPVSYPEDEKGELLKRWKEKQYRFPYLIDETQEVAKSFNAVCTPDLFLYTKNRTLFYHGRLDDNWKDPKKVTKNEMKEAVDALLRGDAPPKIQNPCLGCSIKWKQA